jgi:hypothetical protein
MILPLTRPASEFQLTRSPVLNLLVMREPDRQFRFAIFLASPNRLLAPASWRFPRLSAFSF